MPFPSVFENWEKIELNRRLDSAAILFSLYSTFYSILSLIVTKERKERLFNNFHNDRAKFLTRDLL